MDSETFEAAADAVVTGNLQTLEGMLAAYPTLARARSAREHHATLLHYVGANGVEQERQKSPPNANDIAEALLKAGAEVDAVMDAYGGSTALGLVATSGHPQRAGVQIQLMETLLAHGASLEGVPGATSIVVAALHNGRGEAAAYLARRGAVLTLEGAAGTGSLEKVKSFFDEAGRLRDGASEAEMASGFVWASEYGHDDVVEFLLDRGADPNRATETGLSGLHWAVVGGQAKTARLLLDRGASLEARNRYGGTALGQALWSASQEDAGGDYGPVIELLRGRGAAL